jgi:hypothetical protein
MDEPSDAPAEPAPRRKRWLKWLMAAGIVTCCCCGGWFAMVPLTLGRGERRVADLHDRLRPGMSVEQLFETLDRTELRRLGPSDVFLFPRGGEECLGLPLVWNRGQGSPFGRGTVPAREVAARQLAACDGAELMSVVLFSRYQFLVELQGGKVARVGPIGVRHE